MPVCLLLTAVLVCCLPAPTQLLQPTHAGVVQRLEGVGGCWAGEEAVCGVQKLAYDRAWSGCGAQTAGWLGAGVAQGAPVSVTGTRKLVCVDMVYVDSFSEFQEGAQRIFAANPGGTRYSIKYRHTEGKLVLKVTDDVACLKFKTDQQQDVKRMEKLNMEMFRLMILGADGEVDEAAYAAARGGAMPASPSRTPSKRRR